MLLIIGFLISSVFVAVNLYHVWTKRNVIKQGLFYTYQYAKLVYKSKGQPPSNCYFTNGKFIVETILKGQYKMIVLPTIEIPGRWDVKAVATLGDSEGMHLTNDFKLIAEPRIGSTYVIGIPRRPSDMDFTSFQINIQSLTSNEFRTYTFRDGEEITIDKLLPIKAEEQE